MIKRKNLLRGSLVSLLTIPLASAISCGSENEIAVGFIVTSDGKITDGYFQPMWNSVKASAEINGLTSDYIDLNKEGATAQKDAVQNFIENGSKLIFQPGFENSKSILSNAVNNPEVNFVGVSYSNYVVATEGFTISEGDPKIGENLSSFEKAKNLGLVNFKTHEQGFLLGFLGAEILANSGDFQTGAEIKYSEIASKNYQDITALMDGYLAGVRAYSVVDADHTYTYVKQESVYTTVTVESPDFHSKMQTVASNSGTVDLMFVGDPNAIGEFKNKGIKVVADGGDYKKDLDYVLAATDKNWGAIFNNAIDSYKNGQQSFEKSYHDVTHLSSIENKELIMMPSDSYNNEQLSQAKSELKKWENSLNQDSAREVYETNDDTTLISGGSPWIGDLQPKA